MTTFWSDVSEWQCPVDDSYPYPVLSIRSNDGTYTDQNFAENYAWAMSALAAGRLRCLIVYLVYRQNWAADLATLQAAVGGAPPDGTVFMLDVESWSGAITGDNSTLINNLYGAVAAWVGDPRRVIGYGNPSDLATLWPSKPPGAGLIIADYSDDPELAGELGHQFTDGTWGAPAPLAVPPFGLADVNSAGYGIDDFCDALGLTPVARATALETDVILLPATDAPTDPTSDPSTWPERNYNVGWNVTGGWEGGAAWSMGVQDWAGPKCGTRGYLYLASWIMGGTGQLIPIEPYSAAGKGAPLGQHALTAEYAAPDGAVGITLNYAAPAGGYVALGREA